MPQNLVIVRVLQVGLIALAVVTFQRQAYNFATALDFALNRPASIYDQQRTILEELPRFFFATNPDQVVNEALERGDTVLAKLYIEYAAQLRQTPLSPETLQRYEDATTLWARTKRMANDCAIGAVFRESDNMTAIGCQLATDMFVVGDLADIAKEGADWYYGREVDEVILGLSLLGAGASALSLAYPASAPAAGGVAAAKVIARSTNKGFRIAKPLRAAVRNAIDFDALERARRSTSSWRQAVAHLENPAKFLRPKETTLLMNGLSNIATIGQKTDVSTATRVLRRAEDFDDLTGAVKIINITGSHSKTVLNVMGLKALGFAKVAKPYVSATKFIYKTTISMWALLAGFTALALEYIFRKQFREALSKRNASSSENSAKEAERFGHILGAFGVAIVVTVSSYIAVRTTQRNHVADTHAKVEFHESQRKKATQGVYVDLALERAEESDEIAGWLLQRNFRSVCSGLETRLMLLRPNQTKMQPSDCDGLIDDFHAEWGIQDSVY